MDIALYYRFVISDPCGRKVFSYAWRVMVSEDVLGFCALVLTMLMSLGIVVWFSCSIADKLIQMSQRHKKHRYKVLVRENERLKSFLADVEEENSRLRKVYHTEVIRRKSNSVRQNVA